MSVFETVRMECPACAEPRQVELVHSVNAARRPDLRSAILERRFQRETCGRCGTEFRVPPRFTYLDVGRRGFIAVYPPDELDRTAAERHAVAAFERAYGAGSDGAAVAAGMRARAVFGWPALNEKLLCEDYGIDDTALELAKVAALRRARRLALDPAREWRLIGRAGDDLVIGSVDRASETLGATFAMPAALPAEIAAAPGPWADLRGAVAGEAWVDYQRALAA